MSNYRTITLDYTALMRQADSTAHTYLRDAVRSIDDKFGDGYAENNPALVGAYMQTASHDFGAVITVMAIETLAEAISDAGTAVVYALETAGKTGGGK